MSDDNERFSDILNILRRHGLYDSPAYREIAALSTQSTQPADVSKKGENVDISAATPEAPKECSHCGSWYSYTPADGVSSGVNPCSCHGTGRKEKP